MIFRETNHWLLLLLAGILFTACSGTDEQSGDEADYDSTLVLPRTDLMRLSEFKTPTGKVFVVRETPMFDTSLVNVIVKAAGFSRDTLTIDFGEMDPIIAVHLDDLDKDGYGELYVITRSTGSGQEGTIVGLCSNQDQQVSVISFEGATPYTMKEGEPYEGYLGHDSFSFDQGILTNTFQLSQPGEKIATAGNHRTVRYELIRNESSARLRPVRQK
ncbi:MAG: hypothetical protein JNL40_07850 [Cyclobacteriaceae bacterium]|nr:hypothetical protein [Cyclobacteriaceae bacterium]